MPRTIFAALRDVEFAEFVAGIFRQEVGQKSSVDGGQGADGFEIAEASAIASRLQAFDTGDALVRNQHVAEFAAETLAALDDVAVDDDAAAEAGADDGGNGSLIAVGAEDREVSPERAGVAVVEIRDGLAELRRGLRGYRSRPSRRGRSWWSLWR